MSENSKITVKKRRKPNNDQLWKQFDIEIVGRKEKLELLYSKQKLGERTNCELCNTEIVMTEDGFLTCKNTKCGIIYKDRVIHSAEWRYYGANHSNNVNPTRCGMPINPLLKESSYGCKVLCNNRSTYEMRKIRRYTEWQSMPYKEKSQYDEFQRIKIMAGIAGISKMVINDALWYHKKISETKTFRGENRDGIIAASIYISSRVNKYPRTAKEIALIFKLNNTAATRGCKNAVHLLNTIEKDFQIDEKTYFQQMKPVDFIERFCSKLNLCNEITKVCQFVALRIENKNLIPENTTAFCCSWYYLFCFSEL